MQALHVLHPLKPTVITCILSQLSSPAGHSLGGALATLAAFDVRRLGKKHGADPAVSCITFGAPRTGNRQFSREFEAMVPDCWHIINGKMFLLLSCSHA